MTRWIFVVLLTLLAWPVQAQTTMKPCTTVITNGVVTCPVVSATAPLPVTAGSGGLGAVTIADGADVTQGAKADSAWVSGDGTVVALLKNIANGIASAIAAGTNYIGQVGLSTLQSGVQTATKQCDSHAIYDASDNGKKTLVAGVSAKKIYVCGYILATGGTATNLGLYQGSDADCASNSSALTPAYQLVANDRVGAYGAFTTGLQVSTNAYYLCVNASAGNAHQIEVWYTVQ